MVLEKLKFKGKIEKDMNACASQEPPMPPKTLQIRNSNAEKELDEISVAEDFSAISAESGQL